MKRRDFIKIAGLATGASALPGCIPAKDEIKLVSDVNGPPEGTVPGDPYYINTTCMECPANCGLTATLINGKVIKLEGLKGHPVNDGRTCVRGQASLARLHSPYRVHYPLKRTSSGSYERITLDEAAAAISRALSDSATAGQKSYYLASRTTGTLSRMIDIFCKTMGVVRAPEFELFDYGAVRQANLQVFGKYEVPTYNVQSADFLLTVGADIVSTFGSPVENARKLTQAKEAHNIRWAHVEPHASIELFNADMRYNVKPGSEAALLRYILNRVKGAQTPSDLAAEAARQTGLPVSRIARLADDFARARRPLVIAGGVSTAGPNGLAVATLAAQIQKSSGAGGSLLDFTRPQQLDSVGTAADLDDLKARIASGNSGVVFVSRTDPAGSLAGAGFTDALAKARLSVALVEPSALPGDDAHTEDGAFLDATARQCDIILPIAHYLETWGDAEPKKGLRSVVRPVASPHVEAKPEGDILLGIIKKAGRQAAEPVSFAWMVQKEWGGADSEEVNKGFAPRPPVASTVARKPVGKTRAAAAKAEGPALVLAPSLRYYDGRSKSIYLLNEIPDPLSTITHGEWVSISEKRAEDLGVANGDLVEIKSGDWSATLPAYIQPMLPDDILLADVASVAAPPTPVDPATGAKQLVLPGIQISAAGGYFRLPILSGSPSQEGRGIIPNPVHLNGSDQSHEHGEEGRDSQHGEQHEVEIYPKVDYKKYRWAMTIDLDKCTGCSACVAACYVENNLPVVGPEQHRRGREMSWIRIEPYYDREAKGSFIPMLCQQCGNAPCEAVCPVFAAYHNSEGLNAQVYNRCVGTRYCANNCPYKVRRFNWYDWDRREGVAELNSSMMLNPNISRRGRGIMEKCTFCVHRIRQAKDDARDQGRDVKDGDLLPACAQACPSNAIVFGNLLDEESLVKKETESERGHRVLESLGTAPAVTYLARILREQEA